jgi:hypothetical protein
VLASRFSRPFKGFVLSRQFRKVRVASLGETSRATAISHFRAFSRFFPRRALPLWGSIRLTQ